MRDLLAVTLHYETAPLCFRNQLDSIGAHLEARGVLGRELREDLDAQARRVLNVVERAAMAQPAWT